MDTLAIVVACVVGGFVLFLVVVEVLGWREDRKNERVRGEHPEWRIDVQNYTVPVRYGYKEGVADVGGQRYLYKESAPQQLHEAVVEVLVLCLPSSPGMVDSEVDHAMRNMGVRAASMAELEALRQANVGTCGGIIALGSRWERRYGEEDQYVEDVLVPRLDCVSRKILLTYPPGYVMNGKLAVVRR